MSHSDSKSTIIFGASGEIGKEVAAEFESHGDRVIRLSSDPSKTDLGQVRDNGSILPEQIVGTIKFSSVVWCQGVNTNDSILKFDRAEYVRVLDANLHFVTNSLSALLDNQLLQWGAKLVVISSIWQQLSRDKKLSYTISKSALGGLVRSASVELAPLNILINAVMPGVVDTAMTRKVLSDDQIVRVRQSTPFNRLVTSREVAKVAYFLCSDLNSAVTGLSIPVDLGFSNSRTI